MCLYFQAAAEYMVDDIWPDISERVPSLGISHPHPHFYRRKCTGQQAEDVLKNVYAMPSNTYTVRAGPPPIPIEGEITHSLFSVHVCMEYIQM